MARLLFFAFALIHVNSESFGQDIQVWGDDQGVVSAPSSIQRYSDGSVVISSARGLFRFNGSEWSPIPDPQSIPPHVHRGMVIHNDTIYAASEDRGLFQINPTGEWDYYHPDNSDMPWNRLGPIAKDRNSHLWMALWNPYILEDRDGLSVIKFDRDFTFQWYNVQNSNIGIETVYDIEVDAANNVWFVGDSGRVEFEPINGVVKFDGSQFKRYNSQNYPLIGDSIYAVAAHPTDSSVWLMSVRGLFHLNYDGELIDSITAPNLPGTFKMNQFNSGTMAVSPAGKVWANFFFDNNNRGVLIYDYTLQSLTTLDKNTHLFFNGGGYNFLFLTEELVWISNSEIALYNRNTGILSNSLKTVNTYPNPCADYLTIAGYEELRDFKVYDTSGKLAYTESSITGTSINVSILIPGTYFFTCTDGNGNTIAGKFVKE